MTHTAGLPAGHYDPEWASPVEAWKGMYDADLVEEAPGECFEYSCLSFVHLSAAARQVTGESLADLAEQYVFGPAGMDDARMGPVEDEGCPVAVTYGRKYADRAFAGEIHDPTARALAGESGNAGLFATVDDYTAFASSLLRTAHGDGGAVLSPTTLERAWTNWLPEMEEPHGLGWRIAHDCYPAPNWSLSSVGHTGYTGTSIWIDPDADRFAILLTNEVYCGKDNGREQFRERFHGAVAGERY